MRVVGDGGEGGFVSCRGISWGLERLVGFVEMDGGVDVNGWGFEVYVNVNVSGVGRVGRVVLGGF